MSSYQGIDPSQCRRPPQLLSDQRNTNYHLDSNARVFGLKELRVVDASSRPFLPPVTVTEPLGSVR